MFADRVKETSTTTGTGDLTLAGAVTDFRTFTSQFATGSGTKIAYVIVGTSGEFEQGYGYLSSSTVLVRGRVEESSNSDALVNFSAGTKTVFCAMSAKMALRLASASAALSAFS